MSDSLYKIEGVVIKCFPGSKFQVEIVNSKKHIIAHLSGKIRKNKIRVSLGDNVTIEQNSLNADIGRIVFRSKK